MLNQNKEKVRPVLDFRQLNSHVLATVLSWEQASGMAFRRRSGPWTTVEKEGRHLVWERDNDFGPVPESLTKRELFSLCGRRVGHLPVCGWLRPAASYIKRVANKVAKSWDDKKTESRVLQMLDDVMRREDRGRWNVTKEDAMVWVDASSLALGVVVEIDNVLDIENVDAKLHPVAINRYSTSL